MEKVLLIVIIIVNICYAPYPPEDAHDARHYYYLVIIRKSSEPFRFLLGYFSLITFSGGTRIWGGGGIMKMVLRFRLRFK